MYRSVSFHLSKCTPNLIVPGSKTLDCSSTVIDVFIYQLFAYTHKKGSVRPSSEDNSLINHDKLLAQFTQILGLQNILFSLISPIAPQRKMTSPPRLIYVDDTSPLISYQGPWADGDAYVVNSLLGLPFNNTLHALPGNGSFTFDFSGE